MIGTGIGRPFREKTLKYCEAVIFACFLQTSQAQTYYFDTYTAAENASSKIYSLCQDKDHYVWLGTREGVLRFDGLVFEKFTESHGLAPRAVRTIFQDSREILWLGHEGGGISRFKENEFSRFQLPDLLIQDDITSVFEDYHNRIWITTYGSGAFLLSNPTEHSPGAYQHFLGKKKLSDRVSGYCLTLDSSVYLITDAGIRKYAEEKNEFEIFHPRGLTRYFSIIVMYEDRELNLWFGTYNGGLYKYDRKHDSMTIYDIRDGLASNWISDITQDRKGNMWIGSFGGGMTRINTTGLTIFNRRNGLEAERIFSVREDVEGNILIASSHKGLAIFKGEIFQNFTRKDGLRNQEVFAVLQDGEKNYRVGTNHGICFFDPHFQPEKIIPEQVSTHKIRFLRMDKKGRIWTGTEDHRVIRYDPGSKRFEDAGIVNRWFSGFDRQVSAMEIDKLDRLWVGTREGLIVWEIDSGQAKRLSNTDGLIGNDISALYCDKGNTIWVGAANKAGFSAVSEQGEIKTWHFETVYTPSCFIKDSVERLWTGTIGHGVLLFRGDTLAGTLGMKQGLLSNRIHSLTVDQKGRIYIGSNSGLNVYDPATGRIQTFSRKNGYTGVETNPSASYIDCGGNVWHGTNKGLSRLNPSALKSDFTEPHIRITGFRVNQIRRKMNSGLKLRYYENHIQISYKSICLANPEAVRYRILLEGLDKAWQDITTETAKTYAALQPGSYTFHVKACNSEGTWSRKPAAVSFQIQTPVYFRWYFILSVLSLLFIGFWTVLKIREQKLNKEKKNLERKVAERTRALKEAHDELEIKNRDITASIRYARRIQSSILPPEIPFRNTFVLFKPKAIVSGDFYWMGTVGDKEIMAAVDCTGHGVPGAFMSFIGYNLLNGVIREKGFTRPALILEMLNNEVIRMLHRHTDDMVNDGMDMALVCLDSKSKILQYAGAYNSLYLIRNGELTEIKADRRSIGMMSTKEKKFTNHSFAVHKGDTVYIFSDGYADQFGGENQKKFKTGAVKNLLLAIQDKSMKEQKEILNQTIEKWRGCMEQIDDILFIGRRF